MNGEVIISEVHRVMEVEFIQQALFEMVTSEQPFKSLLVVNHHDHFLSLSNEENYIFLVPIVSKSIIDEVQEYSNHIFNRKILFVQLRNQTTKMELKNHHVFSASDIIEQAIRNGIPENNLFLRILNDAFESTLKF